MQNIESIYKVYKDIVVSAFILNKSSNWAVKDKHYRRIIALLNIAIKEYENCLQNFDELSKTCVKAGRTLTQQNQEIKYLHIALGDMKDEVLSRVTFIKKAIEMYKNNDFRKD